MSGRRTAPGDWLAPGRRCGAGRRRGLEGAMRCGRHAGTQARSGCSTSSPSRSSSDAVGHVEHHRVVGRDDRGHALGPDHVPEQHHDHVAGLRVELAGRLVGEQDPRPVGQGPGDRDPLLLATGQLVRPVLRPPAQTHQLQQIADARVALARIRPDEPERDLDVLGGRQDRHQPERLEDERDRPAPDVDELVLAHRR